MRWFEALIPAYVIERLFWESRGISVAEVVYLEMWYALIVVLLEIPTGIWADRTARRRLIQCGFLLEWLSFLVLLYAFSFTGFAVAIGLSALGSTLRSGAENALLYDTLDMHGRLDDLERYLGRFQAIGTIGAVVAAMSGSLLTRVVPFEVNYWLSLGSLTLATLCSLCLIEPKRTHEVTLLTWSHLLSGLRFIWDNRAVRRLTIGFLAIVGAFNFIEEFWQLYVRDVAVPFYWFGAISTCLLLSQLPGQLFAEQFVKWGTARQWIRWIGLVCGIGFLAMGLWPGLSGLWWMIGIACLVGTVEPLFYADLHRRVPSAIRATTESSVSLVWHMSIFLFGMVFVIGSSDTLFLAFAALGLLLLVAQLVFVTRR